MSNIKHLSIPEPCTQNWKDMTPGNNGRYCGSCAKTVVDFTGMTPEEILKFIAGQGNTCGRFNQFQIDGVNDKLDQSEKSSCSWRKGLAAASLVGILSFVKAEAKPRYYSMEQAPVLFRTEKKQLTVDTGNTMNITGTVIGNEGRSPIPGTTVTVKGTNLVAMTDTNGYFKLIVPGIAQVLVISKIGCATQELPILNIANTNVFISMEVSKTLLGATVGGVVIVQQPLLKRLYYRFIKRHIHRLFG